MSLRRLAPSAGLVALALLLGACSSHKIEGKVVEGPQSIALLVDGDDPRLQGVGVPGASLELVLDPRYVHRKHLATDVSGGDGSFAIPVKEFGAGVMENEISVLARQRGYNSTYEILPLPTFGKKLLIILARGRDLYVRPEDPLGESRPYLPPSELRR